MDSTRRAIAVRPLPLGPWYAASIGILVIVLMFTHATRYLFVAGISPVDPVLLMVTVVAVALPLLLLPMHVRMLWDSLVFPWGMGFLALTVAAYFVSPGHDVAQKELLRRFLSTLFLYAVVLAFADLRNHRVLRLALVAVTLLACALNFVELLRPLTFSPIIGRSAGLYVNPNISGSALVVGLILGIDVVRVSWRPWFVIAVVAALITTLSRTAMLGAVVALAILLATRRVALRQLVGALVAVLAFSGFLLLVIGNWNMVIEAASLLASPDLQRLTIASEAGGAGDSSINTRLEVISRAWALFRERPILGNGLGATVDLLLGQGSHNIYFRDLAEYGILGLFITPGFVLASCWGARREVRALALSFGAFVLLWGFSSHDLLDEWQFLVGAAMLTTMSAASRRTDPFTSNRP